MWLALCYYAYEKMIQWIIFECDKKNLSRAIKSMKFSTYQFCSMIGTTKRGMSEQ